MQRTVKIIFMITFLFEIGLSQSALFLLITPSIERAGMAETGVASPSNDPAALQMNPATGTFYSQSGARVSHIQSHSSWLPGLVNDMYIDVKATLLQINTYNNQATRFFSLNTIMFGQYSTYLDAGKQRHTGPNGEDFGTFTTYFKANNSVLGFGFGHQILGREIETGVGITFKRIIQHLTDGGSDTVGEATNTAADFGFIARTKFLLPLKNRSKGEIINITPALGYAQLNIGDEVVFNDAEQADPLPRTARFGISIDINLMDDRDIELLSFRGERSATDNLIDHKIGSLKYQSGLGDINPINHVLLQEESDKVTIHNGFEMGFGEIIWLRAGNYHDSSGKIHYESVGLEVSFTGFIPWLSTDGLDYSLLGPINRYLGVHYLYSEYHVGAYHPLHGTRFQGIKLELKHLDELLSMISPKH